MAIIKILYSGLINSVLKPFYVRILCLSSKLGGVTLFVMHLLLDQYLVSESIIVCLCLKFVANVVFCELEDRESNEVNISGLLFVVALRNPWHA